MDFTDTKWLGTHKDQASRHSGHAIGKTNGKKRFKKKSFVLLSIIL